MNALKFKPTTTKHSNKTNNNNQPTPELKLTPFQSVRYKGASPVLLTPKRVSNSSSQTATNYQTNPKTNPQTNPDFTIIEVVLVLAIAGLIFLMVFIALPALQRSQRDTARKNDVALVSSAIKSWRSNNRGVALKSETALDITDHDDDGTKWGSAPNSTQLGPYLQDVLSDNTTTVGIYDAGNSGGSYRVGPSDTEGHITVSAGRRCPSSNLPTNNTYQMTTGKPSDAAVIVVLETGGFYCLDSQ